MKEHPKHLMETHPSFTIHQITRLKYQKTKVPRNLGGYHRAPRNHISNRQIIKHLLCKHNQTTSIIHPQKGILEYRSKSK